MKKILYLFLSITLILGTISGCGQKSAEGGFSYTANNEIFTYERVDSNKEQLIVSRTGNVQIEGICNEFEALNPDVQVIYLDITGGNQGYVPAVDWIKNGVAPDVMISTAGFFTDEEMVQYFENMSSNPLVQNFEAEALNRTAVNSNVYILPGPSNINCMIYNKTLFEQYGWQVPKTFDDFVQLCQQIDKDTNGQVEPWNPNAKYSDELLVALEAFVYEEVFGGAENRRWYNDFLLGKEKLKGHMEPYFHVIHTLADKKILREEHFTYSATTRGLEFSEGKIAMINSSINNFDNEMYDFGFFPFPTTKGTIGYVSDTYSCLVSVPKKEHSQEKRNVIDRFLEFFSSEEGQKVFIGNSMMVSNVKNVPLQGKDDLAALEKSIGQGNMFEKLSFDSDLGTKNLDLYQAAIGITNGTTTGEKCISDSDESDYVMEDKIADEAQEIVASAPKNMTILETSFYIADAYREKTGADIGLIADNEAFRGNLMRIFAGDITSGITNVLTPRSFENGSTLVKVSMTGSQILEALNSPPGYGNTASESVYAFSGLKCEVAPWNPAGQKYLSVILADDTEIDREKLYTVAAWQGTIEDKFITQVEETYSGTFEEIITEKMKADGIVQPANDGRIELVWR